MLNISDEVKNLFLKDSTKKKIEIEVEASDSSNPNELNFYSGTFEYQEYATTIAEGLSPITVEDFTDAVDMRLIQYVKYVRLGMGFRVHDITTAPSTLTFRCYVERTNGTTEYKDVAVTLNDYLNNFHYCPCAVFDAKNSNGYITQITDVQIINGDSTAFVGTITMWNYQVDMVNAVLDFPSTFNENFSKNVDDLSDYMPQPNIDNDNIEFESFSLTESLCSQDNIKFGLCESAHCEFTTVNYNYDLKDRTIRPGIRVQGAPSVEDIEKVNFWKDISGVVQKGVPYTRTETITSNPFWTNNYMIDTDIPSQYFSKVDYIYIGYKVKLSNITVHSGSTPAYFRVWNRCVFNDNTTGDWGDLTYHAISNDYIQISVFAPCIYSGKTIVLVRRPYIRLYDSGKTLINPLNVTLTYSFKEFQVQPSIDNSTVPDYDPDMLLVYDNTLDAYCAECYSDTIPLGVFHVTDLKLEHQQNLIKQHVTAYDNIVKLEQNAFNWYTTYMFGMSTSDKQGRYDIQYARQIYSTYFNLMQQLGLEDRNNYTETLLGTYDYWDDIKPSHMVNKWLIWDDSPEVGRMQYAEFTINDVDTTKMYMVDAVNVGGDTDREVENMVPSDYATNFDPLRRGIATNGGVLVDFYKSNNTRIDGIVVNRRDYFMVYPETSYIKVYVPAYDAYGDGTPFARFIDSVSLYEVASAPQLVNGYYRLFYYQYTSEANEAAVLFDANSSMTGRDVIHSVLEVCGCFFRLNRETGKPEFVYCTKGGLYPRNDLYPADDLYPRSGTDQLLPNGRYMSVLQDNYQVLDYGRIQIVRDTDSNEAKSICEWEFKGSDSLNTYLIDDNVFYCNKDLKYEYDSMPYVSGLLQNMWINISNLGYVPNVTQALGMPWIECGDRIGILTYTGGFESFIFRRTMKGIQLLIDTFESEGDEYNEAIKDFGYEIYNS